MRSRSKWEEVYRTLTLFPKTVIKYAGKSSRGLRQYKIDTGDGSEPELVDKRVIDSLMGQDAIREVGKDTYEFKG